MHRARQSPPDERLDTAGRVTQTSTALAGITGSQPVPATKTVYDLATGLVAETVSLDATGAATGSIKSAYDAWGRQTVYTAVDGKQTPPPTTRPGGSPR
jgi:hypothetical protein